MGRKRIELGASVDAEIASRVARGESAKTIAEAIGSAVSMSTVYRRMCVHRAPAGAGELVEALRPLGPDAAVRIARALWAKLTPLEQYALGQRWEAEEHPERASLPSQEQKP